VSAQGELFRAHAHIRRSRANFFAHEARQRGDVETNNTTARPQQGSLETGITSAPEKCAKNTHFSSAKAMTVSIEARPASAKAMVVSIEARPASAKGDDGFNRGSAGARKGDDGFNPTREQASKGDDGFR